MTPHADPQGVRQEQQNLEVSGEVQSSSERCLLLPTPHPTTEPVALHKRNVTCYPTIQVPDQFKTELIMVRLFLLEGVGEPQKKRGSKLSQEIDELCTLAVNLQPCWVRAAPPPPADALELTTPLL